jgi:phosphomannomutase
MGDRFAAAVADELAGEGVEAWLPEGPLPTPATCFHVVDCDLAGAVVLTASHNRADWNGIKVKRPEGASVTADQARWIGDEANRIAEMEPGVRAPAAKHERYDVREAYLEKLLSQVDCDAIGRAKLTVVADLMHGSGAGFFDEALRRAGCAEVRAVRVDPDPTFGWKHPEPIGRNLDASIPLTATPDVAVGMATDGDADRFGMMARGEYIDVQRAIVFILYHLLKNRGWRGRVVRSVNVTSALDRLCEHYGCSVVETSVGFKNMAPMLIESDDIVLAVEESGGYGIKGHIPDRDGSLAALVACETVACEGKPVNDILSDIYDLTEGRLYFDRRDIRLSPQQRDRLEENLPSLEPDAVAGRPVAEANRIDGVKYIRRDGSWALLRLSGTEPLVRIYAEARSQEDVHSLLEAGNNLVLGIAGD